MVPPCRKLIVLYSDGIRRIRQHSPIRSAFVGIMDEASLKDKFEYRGMKTWALV